MAPYKSGAFVDLASRVNGVQGVKNLIETLPVSTFDDQLRYTIARRISGDPLFWNLALQVNPPIHVVVENERDVDRGGEFRGGATRSRDDRAVDLRRVQRNE